VPDLLAWLADHLYRLGPGVLFAVCMLETAVFIGLVLPVGALIAFAALLSASGLFSPGEVAFAAIAGAIVGDQAGYALGRWFGVRSRPPTGPISRLWAGTMERTGKLFRRYGLLAVPPARATPFVRTVMPWFAGRSGMRWPRFFLFDLIGIALWATVYVGGGFLAGYGWRQAADEFGEIAGALLLVLGGIVILVLGRMWFRRWIIRRRADGPTASPSD
jgi:membrane-associated protein